MEPVGAFSDEEFESSSKIFSCVEAGHFMANWNDANNEYSNNSTNNGITCSNFNPIDGTKSVNIIEVDKFASSDYTNIHHFSDENCCSSSGLNSSFFPTQGYENTHFFGHSNHMPVINDNYLVSPNISLHEFLVPNFSHDVMEEFLSMKAEMVNDKSENAFMQAINVAGLGEDLKLERKISMQEHEASGEEKDDVFSKSPKKPRLPRNAQKGKRNPLSKKLSLDWNDEDYSSTIYIQNHPSSFSSEDDNSNMASQDCKGAVNATLNTSGKTRASRGAATDPQSLYARKRRQRINDRLRILQNLVPNGTKVDISTMLEEAVHYVRFLQLQIKLLGSDEKWMFAPIAYNGMDMGLYNNISI